MPPLDRTPRRCSHVLLRVADLAAAVANFETAGFTVTFASRRESARHAHIWFRSGPIIELLDPPARAGLYRVPLELAFGRGAGRRMIRWARQPEGFCDAAVLVDSPDLGEQRAALAQAGVPTGRAVRWTRRREDGESTRFQFSYPRNDRLPFLVTPYSPAQHPPDVRHVNGATALSRVVLGVRPDDRAALLAVTGSDPTFLLEEAAVTGVRAIELDGLRQSLDPGLLHGAVIRPRSST
ncbi:glyoxalase-like protein [Micromonospora sp. Llam0]|uniref:VOC family protein n=1 Tax=Micromonospora sp. Llam0 TaxID=2485143 RepID=UPI000F4A0119|nr:VOC family protein [Micromonospora sp. Llam0]ROO60462.1 glyoxalase-like protein [Micromonospora sp. Llam0]